MNYTSDKLVGSSAPVPRQPRLIELGERFEKSLSEFQTLNANLRNIAERALGAIPETVAKDAQGPGPATVSKLENYQQVLDGMLSRLRETIERLDQL
jgi:hypothetical protein